MTLLLDTIYGPDWPFGMFKKPTGRHYLNLMKVKILKALKALASLYNGDMSPDGAPYRRSSIILKKYAAVEKELKAEKKVKDDKKEAM